MFRRQARRPPAPRPDDLVGLVVLPPQAYTSSRLAPGRAEGVVRMTLDRWRPGRFRIPGVRPGRNIAADGGT
jgi:hypothetical protein